MPPMLQRLIEGLALRKPALTAAMIHRQVTSVADQQGWARPSYAAVYRVVRPLSSGMVALAHQGSKAYREAFDLIYRREAPRPNEIWQADHTLLDVWVSDDTGKPVKPWLTIILDDYSRAVAGYFLTFKAPSALNTSLALRQAIWRKSNARWHVCGVPDTFYTDHGSDFTSQHMEQVSADLKMELVFSIAGAPRGRGRIERFFETVNLMFLLSQPGYAPEGAPSPTGPNRGDGYLQRAQAYKVLNDAARAAGITEAIGIHTLRKTFGYHAYREGVGIAVIQKLLNHPSPGVTLAYIGVEPDQGNDSLILDL